MTCSDATRGEKIVVKASPYPPVGISFLDLDVQSDSGSDHVSGSSSEGTGETSLEIDPYLESPKTVSEMSPEFQGEHSKRYVDLADRLALLAEDFQLSSSQVHLMGDDLNKVSNPSPMHQNADPFLSSLRTIFDPLPPR